MATEDEDVTSSGAQRPSGSVEQGSDLVQSIASMIARRALVIASSDDVPSALSADVLALSKPGPQQAEVIDLIEKLRPYGVDLGLWLAWFDGGAAPVKAVTMERPIGESRASAEMLDRKVGQTVRLEQKIAAAQRKAAVANKVVEDMQNDLLAFRATNAAVLEFAIFDRLKSIMNSSLSVGPLWTFVRAIGSHDLNGEQDIAGMSERDLQAHGQHAETRRAETDLIFSTLDFMSGDATFESALRAAVLRLAESVQPIIELRIAAGEKPRPIAKIRTTMAAGSRDEVREIIGSLPLV